jgi:hypothetical protein
MNNYQKLFFYEEIIQQIENILKRSKEIKNDKNRIEKIYEELDNDFLYKIKQKGKKENEDEVKECKNIAEIILILSKETFFESNDIKTISKYKSFTFNIFDDITYKYMNTSSEKILTDIKKKDYIINDGRIYIKLESDNLKKYEILIAGFQFQSNHFVPELLFKYDIKTVLDNDFNYLKRYNYQLFKKERMSLNGKELIDKNNKKVGIIYDLKNINSNYHSNNNVINFLLLYKY